MENAIESTNGSPAQEAAQPVQTRGIDQIRTYSVSGLGAALDHFVDSDEKPAESAIRELKPKIVGMLQDGYAIADVILALQQGGMDDVGRRQIAKYLAAAGISKDLKQELQSKPKRRSSSSRRNAPAEAAEGPEAAAGVPAEAAPDASERRMDGPEQPAGMPAAASSDAPAKPVAGQEPQSADAVKPAMDGPEAKASDAVEAPLTGLEDAGTKAAEAPAESHKEEPPTAPEPPVERHEAEKTDAPDKPAAKAAEGTGGGRRKAGGELDKMAAYNALKSLRGE